MKKTILSLLLAVCALHSFAKEDNERESRSKKVDYGNNIIAFNPLHAIADNFVGVGLSYERLVNEYIGIKIPVMKSINSTYTNIGVEVKLYPGKNTGVVRYAIAPSIMFGSGDERRIDYIYNPALGYSTQTIIKNPRTQFGFLLNQTLNITMMKNFYIGIDGGLGINYYDLRTNQNSGVGTTNTMTLAAQFQMAMGFRF
jgi:hypothetical protein